MPRQHHLLEECLGEALSRLRKEGPKKTCLFLFIVVWEGSVLLNKRKWDLKEVTAEPGSRGLLGVGEVGDQSELFNLNSVFWEWRSGSVSYKPCSFFIFDTAACFTYFNSN